MRNMFALQIVKYTTGLKQIMPLHSTGLTLGGRCNQRPLVGFQAKSTTILGREMGEGA